MRPLIVVCFTLFLGCNSDPNKQIQNIEGYWEIESVYKGDEQIKTFKISPVIDYFTINTDFKGFRKKLKPNFNGTFKTSKDVLNFQIEIKNNALFLNYIDNAVKFSEEILLAEKERLVLKNSRGLIYNYKAYKPLKLSQ